MESGGAAPSEVLGAPLALRRGAPIPNRVMKSAMSEVLGSKEHSPTAELVKLYETWADGGAGLLVTGNVMVDRRALGEPRNVVVEDARDLELLRAWAAAGTRGGGQIWMQINHPGKQSPRFLTPEPVSASAVPLGSGLERAFNPPRALSGDEILELIERFARTAAVAVQAGFSGVQIHGAHGYLVNQFLSPHHNRRTDRWGGSLENRAAFVLEVYRAIRGAVGPELPVSIKINSADFQRGGFSEDDSVEVISALAHEGIDLVEVSGGSYEAPAMTGAAGASARASTQRREAYFLEFAERLRRRVDVPLAVTGGFRTAVGMADAVRSGAVDLVGLARPLALEPDLLGGEPIECHLPRLSTGIRAIDRVGFVELSFYENQLARMGDGRVPNPGMGAWRTIFTATTRLGAQAFQVRRSRS
jgi:2,4-dienoyl-CoA reductase-like NADH-dependent reductase (Old Yellow Enzyme family)